MYLPRRIIYDILTWECGPLPIMPTFCKLCPWHSSFFSGCLIFETSQHEKSYVQWLLLLGPRRVPNSQRHGSSTRFSKGSLPKMALVPGFYNKLPRMIPFIGRNHHYPIACFFLGATFLAKKSRFLMKDTNFRAQPFTPMEKWGGVSRNARRSRGVA